MTSLTLPRPLVAAALLCLATVAAGQDLEPRSFSQTPVGMNFAVVALGYAEGTMLFDQATTLEDVTGEITSVAAVYVRTLDFFGASAKATAILPVMWGDWAGMYQGEFRTASRRGVADPMLELSVNFIGAPAIGMSGMRSYSNKWVVGASVRAAVPVGQYYPEKLINLGTNRWALRPRLGASRKSGPLALEAMASVWLFTENDDFFGGAHLAQEPLWSLQFNVIYQFPSRIWFGLGAGMSRGGQTKTNGVTTDTYKKNTRWAGLVSVPLNRRHSLKLIYINGLHTRAGADFDQVSLAWSMHWGGKK
ncbi:transporter [bacterium]|nr:MAG: transporter [bacterium]